MVAVNEYGTSPFSLPSRYIFADLRPPGQPREFKVTAMYITKGNVDVDVSWSKPDSAVGNDILNSTLIQTSITHSYFK